MPKVPESFRNDLNELLKKEGIEYLLEKLKTSDPKYFEIVDKKIIGE